MKGPPSIDCSFTVFFRALKLEKTGIASQVLYAQVGFAWAIDVTVIGKDLLYDKRSKAINWHCLLLKEMLQASGN